jgi:ABC-type glycerol-3-phosphate transport system permease component
MRKTPSLTYWALIFATLLSLFPFYFMFIIATRKLEVINAVPPPFLPGGEFGENFGRVLDNEHAAFLLGWPIPSSCRASSRCACVLLLARRLCLRQAALPGQERACCSSSSPR